MSIKTELTNNEFIKLFGDTQYVRGFTEDAIIVILDHIEEVNGDEVVEDWTPYFMDASEYTDLELYQEYSADLDIEELRTTILEILEGVIIEDEDEDDVFYLAEEADDIENRTSYTFDQIFIECEDILVNHSTFIEEAVELLQQEVLAIETGHSTYVVL